jgi:hypothetical protein
MCGNQMQKKNVEIRRNVQSKENKRRYQKSATQRPHKVQETVAGMAEGGGEGKERDADRRRKSDTEYTPEDDTENLEQGR